MTALIGGSLLLILGSAITLVVGWTSADESLIWTSIAASVGAAIMLSIGYARSRTEASRLAPTSPPRSQAPTRTQEQGQTQPIPLASDEAEQEGQVVAYADRSRFHRPDCRYASIPGGERIARDTALRRGYDPCGVCKP
jgi:hypothetical protein